MLLCTNTTFCLVGLYEDIFLVNSHGKVYIVIVHLFSFGLLLVASTPIDLTVHDVPARTPCVPQGIVFYPVNIYQT